MMTRLALLCTMTSISFIACKTSTSSELMTKNRKEDSKYSTVSAEDKLFHREILLAQGLFRYSMPTAADCRVKIAASEIELSENTQYSVIFSGEGSCINSQYTTLKKIYSCKPRGFGNGDAINCLGIKDQTGNKIQISSERGLAHTNLEIEAPSTVRFSIHRIDGDSSSSDLEKALIAKVRLQQGAYQYTDNRVKCDFSFGLNNNSSKASTSFTAIFSGQDAKCKQLTFSPLSKPRDCKQMNVGESQPDCIELIQLDNKERIKLMFLGSDRSSLSFFVNDSSFQLVRK